MPLNVSLLFYLSSRMLHLHTLTQDIICHCMLNVSVRLHYQTSVVYVHMAFFGIRASQQRYKYDRMK